MNTTLPDTRKNGEKLVVTDGGVRVSGTVHETHEAAQSEIDQRKKPLQEAPGSGTVGVKQQLFG